MIIMLIIFCYLLGIAAQLIFASWLKARVRMRESEYEKFKDNTDSYASMLISFCILWPLLTPLMLLMVVIEKIYDLIKSYVSNYFSNSFDKLINFWMKKPILPVEKDVNEAKSTYRSIKYD